jgi:hypothetical protein
VAAKYLYVASGSCYGGGVTTAAASQTITRYNLADGSRDAAILDFNETGTGDSPVGMLDYDAQYLLVLLENSSTSFRRIDRVRKTQLDASSFLLNSNLNAQLRSLKPANDGGWLVSKSTMIERFAPGSKARVTSLNTNAYVQSPAGACATSATLITDMLMLPSGKTVFLHSAASPNNKIGVVIANGTLTGLATDCLSGQAAFATTAMPTAVLQPVPGQLLVAYGSTTNSSNAIYSYLVDDTTGAISSPVAAWTNFGVVNGPSAMTRDPETGEIFVSNSTNGYNGIEKFTYNSTTRVLTRVGSTPYIPPSLYTRCVSSMIVSD